ncbi:MAG: AAA family ATPase [Gemmatimonadaceae bacterium]|jgi:CO dehydrogenase maturation factor
MRIAIAGKGGSGKTTISGTLARILARDGRTVLAVDADTNPNLAATLGISPAEARDIVGLPRTLMERQTQSDGTIKAVFTQNAETILQEYGAIGPDGVRLIVMGKVGHGGAG